MKAVAGIITGRRSAWIVLLGCLLAIGLALALVPHPTVATLPNPASAGDSARVAQWQADVPAANLTNAQLVWTRTDGESLSSLQQSDVKARVAILAAASPARATAWTQLSDDRTAVLAVVPVRTSALLASAPSVADSLLRTARADLPSDLRVALTGEVKVAADAVTAIDSPLETGLFIGVILLAALLLIVATRSLLLWLVPLIVVTATAVLVLYAASDIGTAVGLSIEPADLLLIFAITVAIGVAASISYILRLRAALTRTADDRNAAASAWSASLPGVAGLSFLVLVAAVVFLFAADATARALGLAAVIGVVLVTVAALVAVPAGLVEFGRHGFWPSVLRVTEPEARVTAEGAGVGSAASATARRPLETRVVFYLLSTAITAGLIAVVVAPGTSAQPPTDTARATINRAFTPGYGNEAVMLVPNSLAGQTSVIAPTTLAMARPAILSVTVGPSHLGRTELLVDINADTGSQTALSTLTTLREKLAEKGGPTATTLVGGPDAAAIDQANARTIDAETVVPIAIALVVLLIVLAEIRARRRRKGA